MYTSNQQPLSIKPRAWHLSATQRALIALLLTFSYYLLGLGLIALLLYIPWLLWQMNFLFFLRFGLFPVGIALFLLWSLFPRRIELTPWGERITAADHPHLFAEIEEAARAARCAMPHEVYLVPDLQVAVAARGGLFGLGARRVLWIGLPILQAINMVELQCVLAHEFAHFTGGDTFLGSWVHQTRQSLLQTIVQLQRYRWLQKPFFWYSILFFRLTQSLSRAQEYAADAVAVSATGKQVTKSALQKVYAVEALFTYYLNLEIAPLLKEQALAPLMEGFALFLRTAPAQELRKQVLQQQLDQQQSANPYDSHPTLRERLLAVDALPITPLRATGSASTAHHHQAVQAAPALILISRVAELEQRLYRTLYQPELGKAPTLITWQEVGPTVYPKLWRSFARQFNGLFQYWSLVDLPELLLDQERVMAHIKLSAGFAPRNAEETEQMMRTVLGRTICAALTSQTKWRATVSPGAEPFLVAPDGSQTLFPFTLAQQLIRGEISPDGWRQQWQAYGLAEVAMAVR